MGKANNLRNRVASYFKTKVLGEKTKQLVANIYKIKTIGVSSEIEAFLLEERLIKKYKPKYNLKLLDDKLFPSVKITIKDKYPKVLIVRRKEKDGSLYFGPYIHSSSLKTALKTIRKIFPYQSAINHPNKLCFYNHLGLCPCPLVTNDKEYKKTIRYIIKFLNGQSKEVLKKLKKERDNFSKNEDFENAKLLQTKINSIENITSLTYQPFEYEQNPNLKFDVIKNELRNLKAILQKHSVFVKNLNRIECFDISNISGIYATGSMVVFTNGEKDSSEYKRFRIKKFYNNKPNDFAMMAEVLERRFKRTDWKIPQLVIIDGGKGQISSVKKVFEALNINIPLIGLAKKEETIITDKLNEIKLAKNSVALHLVMRIRDEAHRFAISYHKKLRSKFIPLLSNK